MKIAEPRTKLNSKSGDNSLYYILKFFKLSSVCEDPNSRILRSSLEELYSRCEFNSSTWRLVGRVLSNDNLRSIAFYFLDYGAASINILVHRLSMDDETVRRNLKKLLLYGFILPAFKLPKRLGAKGGPPPGLYQVPDATADQMKEAAVLHSRLLSPKYRVAEVVAQTLLEDFILPRGSMEITYREIVLQVKRLRIPFNTPDVADLTAKYLHEQGIRIWR